MHEPRPRNPDPPPDYFLHAMPRTHDRDRYQRVLGILLWAALIAVLYQCGRN